MVVTPGSIPFDLYIDPEANEIVIQEIGQDSNKAQQFVQSILNLENNPDQLSVIAYAQATSTSNILTQLSNALDGIGSNFGLTRRQPQYATGIVQFTRTSTLGPTDDFTINQGTKVETASGTEYITTQSVEVNNNIGNLVPISASLYGVSVPVQAIVAGSAGNQPVAAITVIETSVPGFTGVTNQSPIVNGVDLETDAQFGSRIQTYSQSNNVGTKNGYANLILSTDQVSQDLVQGANDPLMYRDNGFGGCVDVYILENSLVQVSQTITAIPTSNLIPLAQQPVSSIVSPSGLALVKDTSVYAGSYKAQDVAQVTGVAPTTPFNLVYIYNQMPTLIQQELNDSNTALDNNVLIKAATEVLVDLNMKIQIKPGYNFSVVQSAVSIAVTSLIDSSVIGASLDASTVVETIEGVDGVSQTYLPFATFNREDQINATPPVLFTNTITAAVNEFLRLNLLTINQF
jgi:uncharacterized phage protein gp47/JayE